MLHHFLLWLNPELAHTIAVSGLRFLQWWRFKVCRQSLPKTPAIHCPEYCGIQFRNRVGLAAGFDKNAEIFAGLSTFGFGFIEVGTVTLLAQQGNTPPRLWRIKNQALINSMGFNNCGVVQFRKNLLAYRDQVKSLPLLANIGRGKNTPNPEASAEYLTLMQSLHDAIEGFVVNFSSPNTPGLRELQNTSFLESLASKIQHDRPIWVKMSPDLEEPTLKEICQFVAQSNAFAGVVLTNTSRALAEQYAKYPGGLSGRPLFEKAIYYVEQARRILPPQKIIIGVGGIDSVERAKEMYRAGANLIEIFTGFVYQGPGLVKKLNQIS